MLTVEKAMIGVMIRLEYANPRNLLLLVGDLPCRCP
jgi:hypothetical protein